MAARLYSGLKSLKLVIDTPYDTIRTSDIRDDLIAVKVWYSTTSGFTPPGQGTLAFDGTGLNITISGPLNDSSQSLANNTTYYVKYALISSIDPDVYDISSQLTATTDSAAGQGLEGIRSLTAYLVQPQTSATPSVSPNPTLGSANTPAAPTNWSTTVPSVSVGEILWYIFGRFNPNSTSITYEGTTIAGYATVWSSPVAASVFQDIKSDNWNGSNPPTSGDFGVGATSGYYLNKTEGSIYVQSAYVKGTLLAGSVIIGSATIDSSGGTSITTIKNQAANALATTNFDTTLQTKLTSGVTNILAGQGATYQLLVGPNASTKIVACHQDVLTADFTNANWPIAAANTSGVPRTYLFVGPGGIFMGKYADTANAIKNHKIALDATTGDATFTGTITAGSSLLGTLIVGSTPAISGTTMTGSGALINSGGTFALGNSTNNITYNGTNITLNGTIVAQTNIINISQLQNSSITISGNNITGIGTGNNTAVANSAITINAAGALSGAGGGTVTLTGIGFTGAINANHTTIDTNTGAINGVGTGAGTIVANTKVTINAAGALSGAGGGTVTYSGLGGKNLGLIDSIVTGNVTTYMGNGSVSSSAYSTSLSSTASVTIVVPDGTAVIFIDWNLGEGAPDSSGKSAGTVGPYLSSYTIGGIAAPQRMFINPGAGTYTISISRTSYNSATRIGLYVFLLRR